MTAITVHHSITDNRGHGPLLQEHGNKNIDADWAIPCCGHVTHAASSNWKNQPLVFNRVLRVGRNLSLYPCPAFCRSGL